MSAILSPDGVYRYRLERHLAARGKILCVIMVNPSTADATQDDATIRKVKGFASRLSARKVIVGNLFAYRSTDVRALASAGDPVGPLNDRHLERMMCEAHVIVAAWGNVLKLPLHLRSRVSHIYRLSYDLDLELMCWGKTSRLDPRHPLMTPYSQNLEHWWMP